MNQQKSSGYAVISIVLVLGVLITVLGITVASTSISTMQTSLSGSQGSFSAYLVQGCAQLALLQLNRNNTLPSSISTPYGSCTVVTTSNVGNNWSFTVTGSFKTHTHSVSIDAQRSGTITLSGWQEI